MYAKLFQAVSSYCDHDLPVILASSSLSVGQSVLFYLNYNYNSTYWRYLRIPRVSRALIIVGRAMLAVSYSSFVTHPVDMGIVLLCDI